MCRRALTTVFALLTLLATSAWADSQIRIVRLSYTYGDVQLDRNDGQGFSAAFLNLPVIEGARLSTATSGYAEVQFEDGSTLRLTPNTIVDFPELRRTDSGTRSLVSVQQGEVYFNLKHRNQDDFRVRAGDQYFIATKDSHFRVNLAGEQAALAVFHGNIELQQPDGRHVDIRKNESVSLAFDDASRYFLSHDVTPEAQDDWDHQRESELETQHANLYADLNQYGSYQSVQDYGSVWRPYGVAYGWSPFDDGSWVFYPSTGYLWVSSYPWGWAPYRYGSWVNVSGIGWCWRQGAFNNFAWNATPVFFNAPAGFVAPVPPVHSVGIGIVNVGRPPRDFDSRDRKHPGTFAAVDSGRNPGPASAMPVNTTNVSNAPGSPRPERTPRGEAGQLQVVPAQTPAQASTSINTQNHPDIPARHQPVNGPREPLRLSPPPLVSVPRSMSPPPISVPRSPSPASTPRSSPPPLVQHYSSPPMSAPRFSPAQMSAPRFSPVPMSAPRMSAPASSTRTSSGGGSRPK